MKYIRPAAVANRRSTTAEKLVTELYCGPVRCRAVVFVRGASAASRRRRLKPRRASRLGLVWRPLTERRVGVQLALRTSSGRGLDPT